MDRAAATSSATSLIANIARVIRGKDHVIEAAVTAFLAGGHLLIEDVPGVGKTVLGRSIARSIRGSFKRVQATPDLLPSDITGTSIYNQDTRTFEFIPGPVFAHVVLIDEINRATPRTQSALLEAMDEAAVTIDGQRHQLPDPQFIIATQNPIEHHGTYPLPEGQLDRFAIAMDIGYTSPQIEAEVVRSQIESHPIEDLEPVISPDEISQIRRLVRKTHVDEDVLAYALAITRGTREHADVEVGASTRASIMLVRCAQARALIDGRDFVIPDDIKRLAVSVLAHRLLASHTSYMDERRGQAIVEQVMQSVPVPVRG